MGLFTSSKTSKPVNFETNVRWNSRTAISRIGQRKVKTGNGVKVLQRNIAEQLQAGKYDAARIRVEGCMRDENSLDGMEALTILLEMVATRAETLVNSKSAPMFGKSNPTTICPPELKEAVTSIIWASSVLGDSVPELVALCKAFESKYGKEFVLMSVNNSDLSVNPVLMERFSVGPQPQEKCIQYLAMIAEKFEVEDFDEEKFRQDTTDVGAALGGAAAVMNDELVRDAGVAGAIHTSSGLVVPPMTVIKDDLDQRLDVLRLA